MVTGADGRAVVDALPADARFDLIVVDAYQRTQYVPFQLATVEFFRACARHLEPGGAVGFNVNAPRGLSGRLLKSIATSLELHNIAVCAADPSRKGPQQRIDILIKNLLLEVVNSGQTISIRPVDARALGANGVQMPKLGATQCSL